MQAVDAAHVGGCQNHGLVLGPLKTRCRIILRTQKGTIILTTTHVVLGTFEKLKSATVNALAACL